MFFRFLEKIAKKICVYTLLTIEKRRVSNWLSNFRTPLFLRSWNSWWWKFAPGLACSFDHMSFPGSVRIWVLAGPQLVLAEPSHLFLIDC